MKYSKHFLSCLFLLLFFSSLAVSQAPSFSSTPMTTIEAGDIYTYSIRTEDPNDEDYVTITAPTKPAWLSLVSDDGRVVTTLAGSGSMGANNGNGKSASFTSPRGVAVDASGNVYVADYYNHKIRMIAPNGEVTTLAGSGSPGNTNGNGVAASFNYPSGVALDASGNLYVADRFGHKIRKIAPNGDVTTLAGTGAMGSTDGTAASFSSPNGVAVDASGNVYVADYGNRKIRMIAPNGNVTTLAGSGVNGSSDGTGTAASFNSPSGVAVDLSGNVYVADLYNYAIRKIATDGEVTTLAGYSGGAHGVAVDRSGNIYVADDDNEISKIAPNGDITILAGANSGSIDGYGTNASFNSPKAVAVDQHGNVYVADDMNHKIRRISGPAIVLTGNTTGHAGSHSVVLEADDGNGTVTQQSFTIAVNNASPSFAYAPITSIAASDTYDYKISAVDPNGDHVTITAPSIPAWLSLVPNVGGYVTTLAGSGTHGSTDANGENASFNAPYGTAVDASGNVYVADLANHRIRKIAPNGDVTTLAGTGSPGSTNANGTDASFSSPRAVAVDNSGNVYVAEWNNHRIRKIAPNGDVTTLAGSGFRGSADVIGESASFSSPRGVAVDNSGHVYVADTDNHKIRKIAPNGEVTTLAGTGYVGSVDGRDAKASFYRPTGIAVDRYRNVYVADEGNHKIRKITPSGVVTTLAGSGSSGSADGNGTAASFKNPTGVAVDGFGNVYVADPQNRKIRKITPTGVVSTLAGTGALGGTDGEGTSATFRFPQALAVDASDNVYVADADNRKIRKISGATMDLIGDAAGSVGSHSVTLEATDGFGGTVQQSFTIVVNDVPSVSTSAATAITAISTTLHGDVTLDGGAAITERGFVYSITSDDATPTVAASSGAEVTKVVVTGTTGAFNEVVASLSASTDYSFAAYATNSAGTTEGSVLTFTTPPLTVPTITFSAISKTYGDVDFALGASSNSAGAITYTIVGEANGTSLSGTDTKDVTLGNAGTVTIRATQAADGIYSSTTKDIILTIAPKAISVTVDDNQTKEYGAADPTFTYSVTTGALETGDSFSGSLARATGEDVDTYAITQGTLAAGSNYDVTFVGKDFSITPKAITVTADASQTKEYGAADPTFTYTITSGALETGDSFSGSLARGTGEDVGTYGFTAGTLSAGLNYDMTFVSKDFSITPKAITVTADADQTKVYGTADPAFTYTITSGALETGDSFTGSLARVAGEDVGTYGFTSGTLSAGLNYDITVSGEFSITAKAITVTADASQTKVYGTADPAFAYTVPSGALEIGDSFTGSLARVAGEDVGTYGFTAGTLSAGLNYDITVSGEFSITVKAITVTADASQTKVYGTADPTFTYSVTTGSLEVGDSFTGSLERATGEDVGTYAITQGTLSAGSNYDITFVSKNFSITAKVITVTADASQTKAYGATDPIFTYSVTTGALETGDSFSGSLARGTGEDVGTYGFTAGTLSAGLNYDMTFVSKDFSITPKAITVTADADQTKVYGTADPAFTYTITSGALETGDSFTGSLARVAGEDVGTYGFTSGTLSAGLNYDITVSGEFSITAKAITVTADASQTKVYGTADPAFAYTVPSGALETGDSFTGSLARVAGEDVGTYGFTAGTLSAGLNYEITVSGEFSITAKVITVMADGSQTKEYGAADPAFTYTVTSGALETGDSFTGSLRRVAGEDAGTYAIEQGTLDLGSKYQLVFESSDFTITKANLSATVADESKTFGTENPAFSISYSGFIGSDEVSVLDTAPIATTTATTMSDVGTYPIVLSEGIDNNYVISNIEGTLSIEKAEQTISINPVPDQDITASPISIVTTASSGLEVELSVTGPASLNGNILTLDGSEGTVVITANQAGNMNYNAAAEVSDSFDVINADPCVDFTVTLLECVNNSCFGEALGSIDVAVSGGSENYTYNWSNGETTEDISGLIAGTYSLTVTDANSCSATLEVTITEPESLTISAAVTDEVEGGDGAVDLTVIGGTGEYTYSWSNGATSEDLTSIVGGEYSVTVTDANNCVATATVNVGAMVTAVAVSEIKTNISFYPNPSTDWVIITSGFKEPITSRILDLQGKVIKGGFELVFGKNEIDISRIKNGVYIIEYTVEGTRFSDRIVIK